MKCFQRILAVPKIKPQTAPFHMIVCALHLGASADISQAIVRSGENTIPHLESICGDLQLMMALHIFVVHFIRS